MILLVIIVQYVQYMQGVASGAIGQYVDNRKKGRHGFFAILRTVR